MYDRVPSASTPSATGVYYNSSYPSSLTRWGNVQTNAQPGEIIVGITVDCTGYSCGNFGGNDHDFITVRYKGNRPQNLAIADAPPLFAVARPTPSIGTLRLVPRVT